MVWCTLNYLPCQWIISHDVNTLTNGQSSIYSWGGRKKAKDLLMWRIILTAVRSISLAGWTRLYSRPLGGCLYERRGEYTLFMSSAPQIKTLSGSVAQLYIMLCPSIAAIDVWNGIMMGGKYKNDRTAFSISLQTKGCSCGSCLKNSAIVYSLFPNVMPVFLTHCV